MKCINFRMKRKAYVGIKKAVKQATENHVKSHLFVVKRPFLLLLLITLKILARRSTRREDDL